MDGKFQLSPPNKKMKLQMMHSGITFAIFRVDPRLEFHKVEILSVAPMFSKVLFPSVSEKETDD